MVNPNISRLLHVLIILFIQINVYLSHLTALFALYSTYVEDVIFLIPSIGEVNVTQAPRFHLVGDIVMLIIERLVVIT